MMTIAKYLLGTGIVVFLLLYAATIFFTRKKSRLHPDLQVHLLKRTVVTGLAVMMMVLMTLLMYSFTNG